MFKHEAINNNNNIKLQVEKRKKNKQNTFQLLL